MESKKKFYTNIKIKLAYSQFPCDRYIQITVKGAKDCGLLHSGLPEILRGQNYVSES